MSIRDEYDRHYIYLQKLASGILNAEIYPALEAAYRAARAAVLDAEAITSAQHLRAVQREIERQSAEALQGGWKAATDALHQTAAYEAQWAAGVVGFYSDLALREPGPVQVQRYINASAMTLKSGGRINSGTWAQFVNGALHSGIQQYNGIVLDGYQQKRTVGQISRELRAATDGLMRRDAETLARTGMSHYANNAREAMAAANADVVKYRVFSATFDNRTTLGCRGFDGKHWAMNDDSYPRIPLHFNCRSSYFFVTKLSQKQEGQKVAIGGRDVDQDLVDAKKELRYRGRKDTDIFTPGPISARAGQDDWLRAQPRWFVESALGPKRAALFLDGGMKIDQFTDIVGKTINLAELRKLDSAAKHFRRANL